MKLKRFFGTLIAAVLAMSSLAYAQVSQPNEVGIYEPNGNVYIEGKLEASEVSAPYVTIVLNGKDGIEYIKQADIDENGEYSLKFNVGADIDDCTLSVKEGTRDINSSVTVSKVEQCYPAVEVSLKNDKNNWYFPTGSELAAELNIKSKYGDKNGKFDIVTAFYNDDNTLIGCKKSEISMNGELDESKELPIENVPEGCAKIKAFAWASISTAIPLGDAGVAELDKFILGSEKQEMTIAVVGDSITHHLGSYKTSLEHYYMTRFPERKINFVNKGIGGDGTSSVISRFDFDVMDCEGKKPDGAILVIGTNDNAHSYYANDSDFGKATWNYNQFTGYYPRLIKKFNDNDVPVLLVSPMIVDESPKLTGTKYWDTLYGANRTGMTRIAAFIKQCAEENNLPYVALHERTTALDAEIRAKHPDLTTIFTSNDRIHPDATGAVFSGYVFAEEHIGDSLVASVNIDAAGKKVSADNADVTDVTYSESGVTYTYSPKSVPLAATDDYNKVVNNFEYDITSRLNNEIIKATGLADGIYTVTFDGNYVLGTYSAEELANGVNIATNENNPAQINAKTAYAKLLEKDEVSNIERIYMREWVKLKRKNIDLNDEEAIKACEGLDYNTYKTYRPGQQERTEKIQALREEARQLSTPTTHTVTIQK